jgi:hypothetical protein
MLFRKSTKKLRPLGEKREAMDRRQVDPTADVGIACLKKVTGG